MPLRLSVAAVTGLLIFLFWIVRSIRRGRLQLRGSVSMIVSTLAVIVVTVYPRLLIMAAEALSIELPSNALFGFAFLFVLVHIVSITITQSGTSAQVRRLSQECAMLRAQLEAVQTATASGDDLRGRSDRR